jgi:tetratricopeptide (TPR) repeat protein
MNTLAASALRHATHYLNEFRRLEALHSKGGVSVAESIQRFDEDWPQIRHAWRCSASQSAIADIAATMCSEYAKVDRSRPMPRIDAFLPHAAGLLKYRVSYEDHIALLNSAVEASRRLSSHEDEVSHLQALGDLSFAARHYRVAIEHYNAALAASQRFSGFEFAAQLLYRLGLTALELEDHDLCFPHLDKALAMSELQKDVAGYTVCAGTAAAASLQSGHHTASLEYVRKGLITAGEAQDWSHHLYMLVFLAQLIQFAATPEQRTIRSEYFSLFRRGYDDYQSLVKHIAAGDINSEVVEALPNQDDSARDVVGQHWRVFSSLALATMFAAVSSIATDVPIGRRLAVLLDAKSDSYESKDPTLILQVLVELGGTLAESQNLDQAAATYCEALAFARAIHDQESEGDILKMLSHVSMKQKAWRPAIEYGQLGLKIARSRADNHTAYIILANVAVAFTEVREFDNAIRSAEEALHMLRLLDRPGEPFEESSTLQFLAACAISIGDYSLAIRYLEEAMQVDSGPGPLRTLAVTEFLAGEYRKAIWTFALALTRKGANVAGEVLDVARRVGRMLGLVP